MNVPEGFPRFKSSQQCQHTDSPDEATVCWHCQDNKRTKSSGSPMRRVPIRKSAKASKGLRTGRLRPGSKEYKEERQKLVDRSEGKCEATVSSQCWHRAVDPHHVMMRSRGGSDYAENLLAVCRPCHDWIDAHPKEATERGLLKHGWDVA